MDAMIDTDAVAEAIAHSHAEGGRAADAYVRRSGVRVYDGRRRARGAATNRTGRFERFERTPVEEVPALDDTGGTRALKTEVQVEHARTIISRNASPDLSFDRSINPYRGCEHGCVYCYARPAHAYVGLSAGLDFEQKLFAKEGAADVLRRELTAKGYEARTIALGANTDPYQPIEAERRITRGILEVLEEAGHPVGIVTKGTLVERDIDILKRMAERDLVKVGISITTLDPKLSRAMEPRAPAPERRLETIRKLSEAGIPVVAMVAPIIPGLTDFEVERILEAAKAAGASEAGYVMLRLPREVSGLFKDWLLRHAPDRYRHVLSLLRSMRGGKDYDSDFGSRQTGMGPYAWQIGRRLEIATKRLGLNIARKVLDDRQFQPPRRDTAQLALI